MGSKIGVIVIILVMVVLAGVLIEPPQETPNMSDEHRTYSDILRERETREELTFTFYPARETLTSSDIAVVDFSTNPLAVTYQDIIERSVYSTGANFAGAYSIVTWSCGVSCQNSAIVDVRDGTIVSYGIISSSGLAFSKDSTLLIINPKDSNSEGETVTDYYELFNNELVFVAKEVSETGVLEDCIEAFMNARNVITNEVEEFTSPCSIPFGWEVISNNTEE